MFSQNGNYQHNTKSAYENPNLQEFEQTSKFQNMENSNYEDRDTKFQNDILDEGERDVYQHEEDNEANENREDFQDDENEESMDYENNQFYQEKYKNLHKNNAFKNEYEVVNVENQGENDNDEDQRFYQSDENVEKTPDKNENMNRNPLPKSVSQNNNLVQIKEEDEKLSSNPVQPNDINFYKLQNSKLFQKFLKEEGQPQKKFLNNYTTNSVENKSELPINTYQKNFRTNEDVPKRITPLKQANAREDNKYLSRKSNNEDEKELVGYSQIVPGNIYQPDLIRNNFIQGAPYDYGVNPQMYIYNDQQFYRNPNPQINDYVQKNYYNSNNTLDSYVKKINELNEILTNEMSKNQILEKKCNDYLIHIEQINSNYEEFKRKFLQSNGVQRGDISNYEEKINLLNQHLMENEKKIEELFEENENLKRKLNQEINLRVRYEEDKKQMNTYIDQMKIESQEKENISFKRSDENLLLKRSVDNLKNDLFQIKAIKDRLEEKNKELEIQSINFNNDLDFERKKFSDAKERNKNLEFENEKTRNEINLLRTQINNLLMENENNKNEIYNQNQYLQDKTQKELQITVMLEKANMEINQFKTLLARTEKNLSDQREINQNLIKKLSDIAKDRSSFERATFKNSPLPKNLTNDQMSPSGSLMNYPKNISSEKKLQKEQEYYVTTSKWAVPSRVSQERNQSNDIALQNNQTNNKSAIIQSNNINYHNSNVVVPRRTPANNFNNSSIKAKNYQNSGNILAWQEENINYQANERKKQNNIVNLKEKNPEIKEKNMERGNRMGKEIFNQNFNQENSQKNKYQFYSEAEEKNNEKMLLVAQNERNEELKSINSKVQRAIPESRDRFIKTNDQEYENTLNTIKNIEKNLMLAQIQKEKLENDLRKLEESRTKSAANMRRKTELDDELKILAANISHLKNKLREMNVLHFY